MPSIRATSFRSAVAILITALACIWGSSAQARAEAAGSGVARSVTRPSIKAPKVVVEGARFAVTVAVPSARRATTVQLQFHDKHDYDFESTLSWTKKAAARVNGRAQVVFHVRADEAREAWFRAVVAYRGATRPGTSAAARVNYQHWFPLSALSRYYGVGATDFDSFQMAGRAWRGWYVYGVAGESRYTLEGACVRLRATIGVLDSSSDGATAAVALATIAPGGATTPPLRVARAGCRTDQGHQSRAGQAISDRYLRTRHDAAGHRRIAATTRLRCCRRPRVLVSRGLTGRTTHWRNPVTSER
jgi:hypothetical protein